jgi:hypothetical protein
VDLACTQTINLTRLSTLAPIDARGHSLEYALSERDHVGVPPMCWGRWKVALELVREERVSLHQVSASMPIQLHRAGGDGASYRTA